MNISTYESLPLNVKEKLAAANIYYDGRYSDYEKLNNNTVQYIYNEAFIQVVSIHRMKKFFAFAQLPSEPFALSGDPANEVEMRAFLDEALVAMKKMLKVDWISSTLAGAIFKAYPTKSKRIRWGNYVIDLSDKTPETVFSGFDSKHRNMVRRGEKSNITVKFGGIELLEDYLALDEQTWLRSNKKINNSKVYKNYIKALGENAVIGIAYDSENVPQAGLMGFYNDAMFYYMFGASANSPAPGSTHYLQFQTMKLMLERGVKAYNFVGCRINVDKGSKYEHIQHFKKGFGGDLIECYMFKTVLRNTKFKLFNLIYLLIKGIKMPTDAIDDELPKWAEIN